MQSVSVCIWIFFCFVLFRFSARRHLERITLLRISGLGNVSRNRLGFVTGIYASGNYFTDRDVSKLGVFRHLEELQLDRTAITLRGLNIISALPNLRSFYFWHSALGDDAVQELARARFITTLSLRLPGMNGNTLEYLSSLKQLVSLEILHPGLEPEKLDSIQKYLPNCELKLRLIPVTET